MASGVKRISPAFVDEVSNCFTWAAPKNKRQSLEVIKGMFGYEYEEESEEEDSLKSLINKWKENSLNRALYQLFGDALDQMLWKIRCEDEMTKDQKAQSYQKVFDEFVSEYKASIITKSDGTFILASQKGEKMDKTPEQEHKETFIEKAVRRVTELLTKDQEEKFEKAVSVLEETLLEVEKGKNKEKGCKDIVIVEEVKKSEETDTQGEQQLEELKKAQEQNAALLAELEELKKAQEQTKVELEKAEFLKSAEKEYSMLSGKPEEIASALYNISKSNLDQETKDYVLSNFKSLSKANESQTEEIGKAQNKESVELTKAQVFENKLEAVMKEKSLSKAEAWKSLKDSKELKEYLSESLKK